MLVMVLLLVGGCGRDDPDKTFEQVNQSLAGWSSTIQLAGEDRRALPALYVKQLAKAADKQLDKQQEQLGKTRADHPRRHDLEARLKEVRAQTQAFREATRGGGGGGT